ncbi:MAG TPA: alpha/beta hydrolase, partial [Blastocatellia bacterium]|nr:alpha/beta hydrolase [Blastocatellia bacterium]
KPTMILVHGGLDHARNWDWVARALRDDFHVYAIDLRGHGNSAWAPGALYSIAEHVLDLSALADVINDYPIYLIGHSLGGIITLYYSGVYPDRVKKIVAIEGLGPPTSHRVHRPASQRIREWIEYVRNIEKREPRSYPDLEAAVARMKEANPNLSDEVARHLTLHGTNWNSDGSLIWKFDNFVRGFPPYGTNIDDARQILSQITCPTLLFWGMESWAADPESDGRAQVIKNHRLVKVPNAGHWAHHDQLEIFLAETKKFLADP